MTSSIHSTSFSNTTPLSDGVAWHLQVVVRAPPLPGKVHLPQQINSAIWHFAASDNSVHKCHYAQALHAWCLTQETSSCQGSICNQAVEANRGLRMWELKTHAKDRGLKTNVYRYRIAEPFPKRNAVCRFLCYRKFQYTPLRSNKKKS